MPVEDEISQTEVGVYHNLILENFIEIHKTPSVLASSSNADEFIRLMSDYGAAVRLAYKNNAPAGDIDRWVCDILDVSLNSRQSQLVDHIINGGGCLQQMRLKRYMVRIQYLRLFFLM